MMRPTGPVPICGSKLGAFLEGLGQTKRLIAESFILRSIDHSQAGERGAAGELHYGLHLRRGGLSLDDGATTGCRCRISHGASYTLGDSDQSGNF